MKKKESHTIFLLFYGRWLTILLLTFISCVPQEKKAVYQERKGKIKELSNEYYYRSDIRDILNHDSTKPDIPADVISFGFDSNFIIAKQIPKSMYDCGYTSQPEYTFGPDTTYYWLIINSKDTVVGPIMETEFLRARSKYNVPAKLKMEH